jgi:hypothetical protein
MKLLNCQSCDDVVRITDQNRFCECRRSSGFTTPDRGLQVLGPARVLALSWEAYDGIAEGETRPFTVIPRSEYRKVTP